MPPDPRIAGRAPRRGTPRTAASIGPSPAPTRPLPLSLEDARALVRGHGGATLDVVYTVERDWGWVFAFGRPGSGPSDLDSLVIGLGPVLVDRYEGIVRDCGSSMPAEGWADAYERERRRAQRRARVRGWLRRLWPFGA